MRPSPRPPRTPSILSDSIHHQLNLYAVAATSAGIGMLALAQPAEAKIVYTPAHLKLVSGKYPIDFNHDGKPDFQFYHWIYGSSAGFGSGLAVGNTYAPPSNGVVAIGTLAGHQAVPIQSGKPIGPRRNFASGGRMGTVFYSFFNHKRTWKGGWANGGQGLKNGYVGVRFVIDGSLHYGWARVSIKVEDNKVMPVLTGYAYETIPNKPIIAGQTKGSHAESSIGPNAALTAPAPKPATLGMLALGSRGLSIWRREQSVAGALGSN